MKEANMAELVDKMASLLAEKVLAHMEAKLRISKMSVAMKDVALEPRVESQIERDVGEVFLTAIELTKKLKISRSTIWRLQQEDKFPKAKKASSNRTLWLKSNELSRDITHSKSQT